MIRKKIIDSNHCHISAGFHRKQYKEGDCPVKYYLEKKQSLPSFLPANIIIDSFFRNISIPDYHELSKPEVSPYNRKHENISGKIVQMIFIKKREISSFVKNKYYQG